MTLDPEGSLMEGWLQKRSPSILKRFQWRYVRLKKLEEEREIDEHVLTYAKEKEERDRIQGFIIRITKVVRSGTTLFITGLEGKSGLGRKYEFDTVSESEAEVWREGLLHFLCLDERGESCSTPDPCASPTTIVTAPPPRLPPSAASAATRRISASSYNYRVQKTGSLSARKSLTITGLSLAEDGDILDQIKQSQQARARGGGENRSGGGDSIDGVGCPGGPVAAGSSPFRPLRGVRNLVSKNKKRFTQNGYDLDLSYITPNIIAMGFPAEGVEASYRNPMSEVSRLLDERHRLHFWVYNLCQERDYDPAKLQFCVSRFPFYDHNPPPLALVPHFTRHVSAHLSQSPANVAVVHCKAGKGRTGMLIACYLLESQAVSSAEEALAFFAKNRTFDHHGVTIPSQIRYVHYYARALASGGYRGSPPVLRMAMLSMDPPPFCLTRRVTQDSWYILATHQWFNAEGETEFVQIYDSRSKGTSQSQRDPFSEAAVMLNVLCEGDVRLEIWFQGELGRNELICSFWFNTAFVKQYHLCLQQHELDVANKDVDHVHFPEGFNVNLVFQPVNYQPVYYD